MTNIDTHRGQKTELIRSRQDLILVKKVLPRTIVRAVKCHARDRDAEHHDRKRETDQGVANTNRGRQTCSQKTLAEINKIRDKRY